MNNATKTAVILNGTPRAHGNTAVLVKWIEDALKERQWTTTTHNLYQLNFKGCSHCNACRNVMDKIGCVLKDDLQDILNNILRADAIIVASPVYCWAVSGCTSAALDRFYAFFKEVNGEIASLLKGKKVIGAFSSGGDHFDGMELCVAMMKQLCLLGGLEYITTIAAPHCTTPQELLTRSALKEQIVQNIAKL
jgi:multimeric flavodoxin WrbA